MKGRVKMRRIAALAVMVLLSTGYASAGTIVPQDIGADAKWFGHVNFEAIHSLKLVQDFKEKCPVQCPVEQKLRELAPKLGMNPLEDVLGATFYSNRYGQHLGVALIYVKNADQQKIVGFLKEKHPDCQTSEYGSRTLYAWKTKHQGKKMSVAGTFASPTLIVIGPDAEQVQAALDVLDRKKPGLAADAPLLQGIPEGALMASRAIDVPEEFRKAIRCPVLQNCKSGSFVCTEKDGEIVVKFESVTDSEATAKNFKAVVDGFKALGALRYNYLPAVMKVMDGITCEIQGESFSAAWVTTTADLEASIRAVVEQKAARNPEGKGKKHHGSHKKSADSTKSAGSAE
jgi:hypothetical protein